MYATVSAVDGDDVILEVAPGVDVRYIRRAIMEVISSGEDEETETVEDDQPEDADDYVDDDVHDDAHEDTDHADVHDGTKSDKDNVF
jgi:preprotein translocase subunit YajC